MLRAEGARGLDGRAAMFYVAACDATGGRSLGDGAPRGVRGVSTRVASRCVGAPEALTHRRDPSPDRGDGL